MFRVLEKKKERKGGEFCVKKLREKNELFDETLYSLKSVVAQ